MCHSRHHQNRAVSRQAPEAARRDPELRASDAERESTVTLLREHGAAGRLDVEELEQRVGAAYEARTRGDLSTLLDDHPRTRSVVDPRQQRPTRRPRDHSGHGWAAFAQVSVLLIAI